MFVRTTRHLALVLVAALACGKDTGDTDTDAASTGPSTDPSTDPVTDPATTDTAGTSTGAGTEPPTTGDSATGDTGSTAPDPTTSGTTDSGDATTDGTTTGVDLPAFERFRQSRAAGPCPPEGDCDGFFELLASRTLRFEPFGEVGDPVIEVEISEEDFAAAVLVFTDAELLALLDAPDPLCDPPTDIFEDMLVEVDGVTHDATTTTCDQPPLFDAREMIDALLAEYVP